MLKLTLSHFGVTYDGVPAIVDLSIELTSGEIAAISGKAGAGKSTLMRAIAGRIPHTGELTILKDGHPASLSLISQPLERHLLKPHTRVSQFVLLGLLQNSWTRPADAEARITRALKRCNLLDKGDQPISSLSPSEMRLAELAHLFVQKPGILLIDQPDIELNLINRTYLSCLENWVNETGAIAIAAVPDVVDTADFDKVIVLARGHMQRVA